MRLSVRRSMALAALAGLGAGAGAPLSAQAPVEVHTGIALGAALGQGRSDPGIALFGSAEAGRPGSRLGVRGELLYSHFARDEHGLFGTPCAECSAVFPLLGARSTQQAFGALLGATYRLTEATRVRSYLLGGAGLYGTRTDLRGTLGPICPPATICTMSLVALTPVHDIERATAVGMHVGLGSSFRVGQLDLTAEARYHLLDGAVGSGRLVPLTLGVRF